MSSIKKINDDFNQLKDKGLFMLKDFEFRRYTPEMVDKLSIEEKKQKKAIENIFEKEYQSWFTESQILVKQLIPLRLIEFTELYIGDGKRKSITQDSYNIQDWLKGSRVGEDFMTGKKIFDEFAVVFMNFHTQFGILLSLETRFNSSLFEINTVLQADIFDSELESSKELCKKGFYRASGAICGVILEKHFHQVLYNHNIKVTKKNPALSDLNDLLKQNEIIQTHNWRQVQRLIDIRNICCHFKEDEEPTKALVLEFIDGTSKVIKSIF